METFALVIAALIFAYVQDNREAKERRIREGWDE